MSSHVLARLNGLATLTFWNLGIQSLPGLDIGGTKVLLDIEYELSRQQGEA